MQRRSVGIDSRIDFQLTHTGRFVQQQILERLHWKLGVRAFACSKNTILPQKERNQKIKRRTRNKALVRRAVWWLAILRYEATFRLGLRVDGMVEEQGPLISSQNMSDFWKNWETKCSGMSGQRTRKVHEYLDYNSKAFAMQKWLIMTAKHSWKPGDEKKLILRTDIAPKETIPLRFPRSIRPITRGCSRKSSADNYFPHPLVWNKKPA